MIPLFEAVDGDLMGAGFEPGNDFSSLSCTALSSSGVSIPVLGYGPAKPIQFDELGTSRTSPFTWLVSVFAVFACHGLTCGFTRMPLQAFLCPQSGPCNPVVHGPAMLRASGFPHAQDVSVPACLFTCTEHCRLTWPLRGRYPLLSVLFIYPWYGKWPELKKTWTQQKILPRPERAEAEMTLLVFTTLHSEDPIRGADPPLALLILFSAPLHHGQSLTDMHPPVSHTLFHSVCRKAAI